jgi:hypothetical protein
MGIWRPRTHTACNCSNVGNSAEGKRLSSSHCKCASQRALSSLCRAQRPHFEYKSMPTRFCSKHNVWRGAATPWRLRCQRCRIRTLMRRRSRRWNCKRFSRNFVLSVTFRSRAWTPWWSQPVLLPYPISTAHPCMSLPFSPMPLGQPSVSRAFAPTWASWDCLSPRLPHLEPPCWH